MRFTVIGASGFIGAALAARLEASGEDVFCPARDSTELFAQPLGHVIYAAGVTADFRERPFDTLRAHAGLIADVLEKADFDAIVARSGARLSVANDAATIAFRPIDIARLKDEFDYRPRSVVEYIPRLVDEYRKQT